MKKTILSTFILLSLLSGSALAHTYGKDSCTNKNNTPNYFKGKWHSDSQTCDCSGTLGVTTGENKNQTCQYSDAQQSAWGTCESIFGKWTATSSTKCTCTGIPEQLAHLNPC